MLFSSFSPYIMQNKKYFGRKLLELWSEFFIIVVGVFGVIIDFKSKANFLQTNFDLLTFFGVKILMT